MEDSITNIPVTDEEKKELGEFYLSKLNTARSQIRKYEIMLDKLGIPYQEERIPAQENPNVGKYRTAWNWARKVKYVLEMTGKCMTTREIIEEIKELEPSLTEDPMASVSGTISGKVRLGVMFNRYRPYEGSEQYVGLTKWFDQFGNVYDQYAVE